MKRRFKKKKSSSFLSSVFLFSLLFIIIAFLIISNLRIDERREELISRILGLKKEVQSLEQRREELEAGASEALDPDHTEKILREKGLYKKKGEEMVVIISPDEEESDFEEEEKSIWEKILGKLNLRD